MVLDAWEKIGEELPLFIDYQDIFRKDVSVQEILVKIFADVLEFHHHAIKFFTGRGIGDPPSRLALLFNNCFSFDSGSSSRLEKFQADFQPDYRPYTLSQRPAGRESKNNQQSFPSRPYQSAQFGHAIYTHRPEKF